MDNRAMDFNDLKQHFGSIAKAGEAIGVHRQAVHRWKGRQIPLDQQVAYEVVTRGALKADLPEGFRERAA